MAFLDGYVHYLQLNTISLLKTDNGLEKEFEIKKGQIKETKNNVVMQPQAPDGGEGDGRLEEGAADSPEGVVGDPKIARIA